MDRKGIKQGWILLDLSNPSLGDEVKYHCTVRIRHGVAGRNVREGEKTGAASGTAPSVRNWLIGREMQ